MLLNHENLYLKYVHHQLKHHNKKSLINLSKTLHELNLVCRIILNKSFYPFLVVLPEHSTEVGDLIQPAPGVFYEDTRLKKGDLRRYQVNFSFFSSILILFYSSFDRMAYHNTRISTMKVAH